MVKLSELISNGDEIRLSNGKKKNIIMKKTKNGWVTHKDDLTTKQSKGTSKSVLLKEEPMRYIKKLYASQYKITSPQDVQIDW